MCTVVVSIDPDSPVPILLAGVRDEFLDRPWLPPDRHWPRYPSVIGGKDEVAGGTWLAVDTEDIETAAILNGFGPLAPPETRLSRGDLPLLAMRGLDYQAQRRDPFLLVHARLTGVTVTAWDGVSVTARTLTPGLHVVVNDGLESYAPPRAKTDIAARLEHFVPRLAAAPRPVPIDGDPLTAWGAWLPLIDGDGLDPADSRAIVLRRDIADQGMWGTGSVSLVALRHDGVRYDFSAEPGKLAYQQIPVQTERK